jgi:puromycin-sensitive aminopeptidase
MAFQPNQLKLSGLSLLAGLMVYTVSASTLPLSVSAKNEAKDASKAASKAAAKGATRSAIKSTTKFAEYKRLPVNCRPEKYDLHFEPDLATAEFEGSETLFFEVLRSTDQIVLNAVDLSVFEASVAQSKPTHGDWVKAEISRDVPGEKVILKLPRPLKAGHYELSIKFSGRLSSKMEGFYLSTFKDKAGKEHKIATTQMEPTDARRMFPCFDEPEYKASFKVTVAIDPALAAISNAGVEFEKLDQRKNKKIVNFKASPVMSTYLFALIVGPFESTEALIVDGRKIKVWYTAGKKELASYALAAAGKLLPYYEKYFGQPYPLDKLDLIGVPDFSAGAMENLGAITFRESALLVDEKNSSLGSRMRVVNIVAHEMAHLWFGDLVTMKWWDDLWLNEAFATWMADKAEDVLKPEWRIWDDFALERAGTLDADAIAATRSVQSPVSSPNDALEMFDEITYSKGAALLRMLETYLGEDRFRAGIQAYMKKHAFANASTTDLWDALSSATAAGDKVDVARLMDTWVHSPGCPLVSFEPTRNQLSVSQQRFYLDVSKKGGDKPWQVPLQMKGGGEQKSALLTTWQANLPDSNALIINATGNGYFRTGYSAGQVDRLMKENLPTAFSVSERLSILSDLFALTIVGRLPVKDYLYAVEKFSADQDSYVLSLLLGQIGELDSLVDEKDRQAFQAYVRKWLKPQLLRLTYERKSEDDDLTADLRTRLIRVLGTIGGDAEVISFCRRQFPAYLADEKSIDGNLLGPLVQVVAYNGSEQEFSQLENAWKNATTPESKNRNLSALAAFRKPDCVDRALALTFNEEVRAQDLPRLLSHLLAADTSQEKTFKYLGDNWAKIQDKAGERKMPDIVEACRNFSKPGQLEALKAFIDTHPMPSGRRSAAKTIEFATIGTHFRANQGKALSRFLVGE